MTRTIIRQIIGFILFLSIIFFSFSFSVQSYQLQWKQCPEIVQFFDRINKKKLLNVKENEETQVLEEFKKFFWDSYGSSKMPFYIPKNENEWKIMMESLKNAECTTVRKKLLFFFTFFVMFKLIYCYSEKNKKR